MKISVITLFPKLFESFISESIIRRAVEKKIVEIKFINLRDFAKDKYGTVDDKPYGGGVGMVLRADIIWAALNELRVKSEKLKVRTILTSPKGKIYNQEKAREYSKLEHLIIVAGHYEGVDERVLNYVDEEVSIGDFVLTGGEIPAATIVDSVVRLIPGVLKKEEATKQESFFEVSIDRLLEVVGDNKNLNELQKKGVKKVKLLEYPQYTRPQKFRNLSVPDVLLSGNHSDIEKWKLKAAFETTLKKRRDLIKSYDRV